MTQRKTRRPLSNRLIADDVLREVWRVRDEISASYDYDIKRLCADMRKRQFESGHPVVDLSRSGAPRKASHEQGDNGRREQ